jgi:predicted metal-binding membrane protein
MANKLTNGVARLRLIRLVFAGTVVGFVTLGIVSRLYTLASEPITEGFKVLLGIYLPLIAVMLGFYQDQANQAGSDQEPAQPTMLTFVTYFVVLWTAAPIVVIAFWSPIEDALDVLKWLQGTAGALVAGAVGLFFAKTAVASIRVVPETPGEG